MNTRFFQDRIPHDIQLKNDNVDVWCVSLLMDAFSLNSVRNFLAEDERMKADRLRFKRVREDYVAARGLLRLILATYLNVQPKELEFQYGQHGKPALADELSHTGITFNMSHSHGMALYCVGLEQELGADIEKIREDMSFEKIAKRFFSSLEYEALQKLPDDQLKYGFFNCWTRKEAYIKAKGEGLSSLISRFAVSLAPGEPAALLDHQLDAGEVNRWSIMDLDVGPGYTAALAVEGKGVTVTQKEPWWKTGQGLQE
jgi:4'-phosphopantetheinyl transferase